MPLTRKQQLLAKLEETEGGGPPSSFVAADAIQVFEPSISDSVDTLDRVPAGPTLSRDFTPVGRIAREISFTSELRGSGTAATAPPWNNLIQASAYKKSVRVLKYELGTATLEYELGERITQDSGNDVGVVVGVFTSANVPIAATTADTDYLIVAEITGTLVSTVLTTGSKSGATDSGGTVAVTTNHHVYIPTSEKLIQVDMSASWSGADPALGEVLDVKTGGVLSGAVQVINNNGSFDDLDVVLLWGSVLNGDTLTIAAGGSVATIDSAPVMVRTPSLAMRHNLDGRNRDLDGSRGTFNCEGAVGESLSFSWTFTGDAGTDADAAPIAAPALSTVRPPRMLGSIFVYGDGTNIRALQTKSFNFDNGGVVSPNLDANASGGTSGANVTDRDMTIAVQIDNALSTVDWEAVRDAGTAVRVACVLGTVAGNVMSIVAPNCQVTEVSLSDADGVSVMDVTFRPRRIAQSGDDEVYFSQL